MIDTITPPTLYATCAARYAGSTEATLQCISVQLQQDRQHHQTQQLSWLLVIAGALVFFMQTGFAMLCAGCVRKKNLLNTMLKNLLDACGAAIAFYVAGYALAFGDSSDDDDFKSFMGKTKFVGTGEFDLAVWFFQYAFSATAVTIVAGTLAERCKMAAYLLYSMFLTGFVYPITAHAIWNPHGYLTAGGTLVAGDLGVIDFAGSGVIHLTGGMTALVAAKILGPRRGRFQDAAGNWLEKPKEFPGHSVALQLLGTMILWFGWYGFNPGSALLLGENVNTGTVAATAAVNTTLAAGAGAISGLLTDLHLQERKTGEWKFSLTVAMNGLLTGLVAITAGCGTVPTYAALIIGVVAGWLYMASSALILRWKIDDAVDAIPVHMVGGLWGMIATGLFSRPDLVLEAFGTDKYAGLLFAFSSDTVAAEDRWVFLCNQCIAVVFIIVWVMGTMLPFFVLLSRYGLLRSDVLDELIGLDAVLHGGHFNEQGTNQGDSLHPSSEAGMSFQNLQNSLHSQKQSSQHEKTASTVLVPPTRKQTEIEETTRHVDNSTRAQPDNRRNMMIHNPYKDYKKSMTSGEFFKANIGHSHHHRAYAGEDDSDALEESFAHESARNLDGNSNHQMSFSLEPKLEI